MNLERQRQILKEKHGLDIRLCPSEGVFYEVSGVPRTPTGAPAYVIWSYAGEEKTYVHVSIRGRMSHILHNFVAAVTYAKAELARIERLAAAKENQ